MLGSALGRGHDGLPHVPSGPSIDPAQHHSIAALASQYEDRAAEPPMYNPRTAWHADERRVDEGDVAPSSPRGIAAAGQGVVTATRASQDYLDLDEENRVLRREVARLQQLNEARRKQLADMQGRIDELEQGERELHAKLAAAQHTGRGGHARHVTPSPSRGATSPEHHVSHSPHRSIREQTPARGGATLATNQRIQRLETLVQRWQEKASGWEDRYTTLFAEISKAGARGGSNVAMIEALRRVAPPQQTVADQIEMENGYEAMRAELVKAKDTVNLLSTRLRTERAELGQGHSALAAVHRGTSVSPQRLGQGGNSDASPGDAGPPSCGQCAVYRLRLAETSNRLNDAESELRRRHAAEVRKPTFPFLDMLPGMESLEACLSQALRGRDAAMALLEMQSQYVSSYLDLLTDTPRMAAVIGWRSAPRTARGMRAGSVRAGSVRAGSVPAGGAATPAVYGVVGAPVPISAPPDDEWENLDEGLGDVGPPVAAALPPPVADSMPSGYTNVPMRDVSVAASTPHGLVAPAVGDADPSPSPDAHPSSYDAAGDDDYDDDFAPDTLS